MSSSNDNMDGPTELVSNRSGGHSADVRIKLLVGAAAFDVAQVGGGRLVFSKPLTVPGAQGELVLSIDGHERRWAVAMKPAAQPAMEVEAEFGPVEEMAGGGMKG